MLFNLLDATSRPDEILAIADGHQDIVILSGHMPASFPRPDLMLVNSHLLVEVAPPRLCSISEMSPGEIIRWGTLRNASGFSIFRSALDSMVGRMQLRVEEISQARSYMDVRSICMETLKCPEQDILRALNLAFMYVLDERAGSPLREANLSVSPVTSISIKRVIFYRPDLLDQLQNISRRYCGERAKDPNCLPERIHFADIARPRRIFTPIRRERDRKALDSCTAALEASLRQAINKH